MRLNAWDYQFLVDAYTSLGGFKDGSYLIRYPRETDEKYNRRKQLAVYPNFVKKIVDTFVSFLFKNPPVRDTSKNPEYAEFIEDVDLKGTYIDDFMRHIARLSLIFGTVFVVIDTPKEGGKPYATVRLPSQLAKVELDEYGRIVKVVFAEGTEQFRAFEPNRWIVSKDPGQKIVLEAGEHNLGIVPVVPVSWSEPLLPNEVLTVPFIWDIARLNFDLYNAISELREILRNVTFPVLTLPVKDEAMLQKLKNITIGTENFVPYTPEGGGKPDYIAPPEGPAKTLLEYINFLISQIYKAVNLEFALGSHSQKSGVALEFEFQQLNTLLTGLALQMEKAEYAIADLVAKWNGKERFEGTISYRKDFSFRDLERELKVAIDAIALNISETFNAELKKKLAREILGDFVDEKIFAKIDLEVERQKEYGGESLPSP